MKVKRTLLLVAAGCACAALAWQQQPRKYVILDDKQGGFKLYDVESSLGTFVTGGDFEFDAKGSPIRGFSKDQGLVFSMNALNGLAQRTDAGSFRIVRGNASGNVVFDTSNTAADGSKTTSNLKTARLSLAESDDATTITLPAPFTYQNRTVSSSLDRTIDLSAPSGTFVLPRLDQSSGEKNPFRTANVKGPVSITVRSASKKAEGTDLQVVKVKGDAMTYDGKTRRLAVTGNVEIDYSNTPATGKPYGFTSEGQSVVIVFDEQSAVQRVETGTGSVRMTGGGS